MTPLEQIKNLLDENKKLKNEKRELVEELRLTKIIEFEAVKRYRKVADELLLYYIQFGIINKKERNKKKWNMNLLN